MSQHTLPLFKGNLILRGKIEALTGLHIGGSNEKMQIGGVDMIVIRNPYDQQPYLPGSSLKGKLRHLLEYITGAVNQPFDGKLGNVSIEREIVRLFGIGAEVTELAHDAKLFAERMEKAKDQAQKEALTYIKQHLKDVGLARMIVRDAFADAATVEMWNKLGADANFTEYKAENTIDRLTSAANPRFIERVVKGSKFDFEIIYTAYGDDELTDEQRQTVNDDVSNILMAMRLLENNALGKAGTRGYGRVRFHLAEPIWLLREDYQTGGERFLASRKALDEQSLQLLGGFTKAYHFPVNATTNG